MPLYGIATLRPTPRPPSGGAPTKPRAPSGRLLPVKHTHQRSLSFPRAVRSLVSQVRLIFLGEVKMNKTIFSLSHEGNNSLLREVRATSIGWDSVSRNSCSLVAKARPGAAGLGRRGLARAGRARPRASRSRRRHDGGTESELRIWNAPTNRSRQVVHESVDYSIFSLIH